MDGQFVETSNLPSKGVKYPEGIEIYVKPLTIKEQMDMSRYGITESEYFRILLNGITVKGDFPKNMLYFHDVQFLDLVRRLYTYDIDQEIEVRDIECESCGEKFNGKFHFHELQFTDFTEDSFNQEYKFSDGLEVTAEPITIKDFMEAGKKYFSTKKFSTTEVYLGYLSLCISSVKERQFKDKSALQDFIYEYFSGLFKASDRKILDKIEKNCVSTVVPFKMVCPKCGEITEVSVNPTTQFQQ